MLALVFLGGALGAASRYGLSAFVNRHVESSFPWGTVSVNLLGSFAIGLLYEVLARYSVPEQVRGFLFIGILGGFTTFSAFGLETMSLLRGREVGLALSNVALTNIAGVALVALGMLAGRLVSQP